MSTLLEVQRALQARLLSSESIEYDVGVRVYATAYRIRLVDALASNYPRLQQLLGAERFSRYALEYIEVNPSRSRSIRWYGERFAAQLRAHRADEPWLAELAQLEWAIAAAFDAADASTLAVSDLAKVPPDAWPELSFTVHPSVQLLTLRTNAPLLFKALSEAAEPPTPCALDDPQTWLIWRADLTPSYRSLGATEASLLTALVRGAAFADLCELLNVEAPPEDAPLQAAMLLKTWLADGLLTRAPRN